jgi:RNA-binding protein
MENDKPFSADLKPTVWIGKKGCTDVVCEEIRWQITARNVVKVRFLRSAELDPEALAERTGTLLGQVRGRTVILLKKNK